MQHGIHHVTAIAGHARRDLEFSFTHRFLPGEDEALPPLLLLHGTGGDEDDLLPLGSAVAPRAALLSPRGQVLENGMPRFFRRLREGVFDEEDVRARAGDLVRFIGEAREAYGLAAPVAVGFSNGANIAAAVLLLHPQALAGAALLRAMVPLDPPPSAQLPGTPVLLLSGRADPIAPPDNADRLATILARAGASVDHRRLDAGHRLTQTDIGVLQTWFAGL